MDSQGLWAEAGDTFFTRSRSILGRLIRWGETDPGERNGTWANHTGVVVASGWIVPPERYGYGIVRDERHFTYDDEGRIAPRLAVVVEALWKTQHHSWWGAHAKDYGKGDRIRVFRPVPAYDAHELHRFRVEAASYVGATYGWWKLLFQLGDRSLFGGRKMLTRLLFVKSRPICSFLAAFVNQKAQSTKRILARIYRRSGVTAGLFNLPTWLDERGQYAFGMPPQAADPDEMLDYCEANPCEWLEVK